MGWETIYYLPATPSSASPAVPPGGSSPSALTAPRSCGGAGDGARLGRGPWTGFKVQGRTGTGTGCSGDTGSQPGSAAGLDEAHVQVPAGARAHPASPLGVLGGVRMQTGDAEAQEFRRPRTSRSRLGSLPALPGSRPSPGLVAPGSAIRGWRQPGAPVTGRRCWRCANTAGTGPEAAAANTDSPEICWHGRSATGAGPTAALLEPGPASQRCADGYQGWPGSGGSTTPPENRVKPKPLPVPIPSC